MQYLPCSFNQEMVTDGREKRRKPDMWSPQERNEFIDVFLANGRDFKAVLERVKTKNKEQVRQFYYRSLGIFVTNFFIVAYPSQRRSISFCGPSSM